MKTKKIVITITIFFCFICIISIVGFLNDNVPDSYSIDENGEKLFGRFMYFEGTIYVSIPSSGYHPIPEADKKSFHSISNNYYDTHIGIDKDNVFCGNQIIPKMNPKTVQALGNNYYTDGKTTCYCNISTEINNKLTEVGIREQINYVFFKGEKPQTYVYPLIMLPNSETSYYSLSSHSLATNGKQVFYKGQVMSKANPENTTALSLNNNNRQSFIYFRDGKHVYYKQNLLPIIDNKEIYSIQLDAQNVKSYIYNPIDGMVYIDTISFSKKHKPYRIISKFGSHVYHSLWLSENGVYFYNTEEREVQRVANNPFANNDFKEIAPLVFSNGKKTLFVDAYEKRNNNKNNKSLDSRYTAINRLDNLDPKQSWEKLGDINTFGSVWKHGKHWYYFDNLGESQLLFNTIYKITDQETAESLINTDIFGNKVILKLIKEKKLTKPKYTEILQAKTKYNF
ncbi:DKNYY domain-containing protein [Aquimarina algiphila]|uniref:DKNYY domain-containing protein n=1 Tax=Aquimarina algiphila TaxID=2047982 RepID=UPI00248F577A|nr:DKNYY domain-containing protein [Aquimarina algiphila]